MTVYVLSILFRHLIRVYLESSNDKYTNYDVFLCHLEHGDTQQYYIIKYISICFNEFILIISHE